MIFIDLNKNATKALSKYLQLIFFDEATHVFLQILILKRSKSKHLTIND
jgi:hypothetical protein